MLPETIVESQKGSRKGIVMTCIVAVTDGRRVVMGGDSAGVTGIGLDCELYSLANAKVFRTGPYAIGFTTAYRIGQILRYHVTWPEPPTRPEAFEGFLVTEVVPEVRRALETGGAMRTENGQTRGGHFLLAWGGQLFGILEDFCVVRPHLPYAAIGAGKQAAYGALEILADQPALSLENRVQRALEVAQTYNPWVRAPFCLVSTDDPPTDSAQGAR